MSPTIPHMQGLQCRRIMGLVRARQERVVSALAVVALACPAAFATAAAPAMQGIALGLVLTRPGPASG